MSSQPRHQAAKALHDEAHLHRMGAFGGSQPESLAEYCGTSVQMIEQSYGRYIRKDFLGPLIAARPQGPSEAAVEGKTGPLTGPPQRGTRKRPEFPSEFWWRRGN